MEEGSLDGLILKVDERIYHLFSASEKLSRHQKPYYNLTFVTIHKFDEPYLSKFIPLKTKLTAIGTQRKINAGEYTIMSEEEFVKLNKVLKNGWPEKLTIELKRTIPEK